MDRKEIVDKLMEAAEILDEIRNSITSKTDITLAEAEAIGEEAEDIISLYQQIKWSK